MLTTGLILPLPAQAAVDSPQLAMSEKSMGPNQRGQTLSPDKDAKAQVPRS